MASSAAFDEGAQQARAFSMLRRSKKKGVRVSGLTATVGRSKAMVRLRLYALLVVSDAVAVAAAFLLANLIRFNDPFYSRGLDLLAIILPVFLGIALNSRAYSLDTLKRPRTGIRRAAQSLAFAVAAVIGIVFYLKAGQEHSRIVMAVATAASFIFVCGYRAAIGVAVGRRMEWRFTNDVMIVDEVPMLPTRGEIVVYADQAELSPSTDDPHLLDRVGRLFKNCDRVVVACPADRRAAWSAMLKGADIDVELLSPELDQVGALGMGRYGGRPTLLVSRGPLGLRDRVIKRLFDLALAVPAIVVMMPLLVVIAIVIKLDSKGPVFFKQPRVGLGNRLFEMYKFRSMRTDMADTNGNTLTQVGDKRVTKVGDFLRRTSLDELPQLINVILGDMSIAGPRPHPMGALAGESLYWEVDSRYWHRHAVKPGMTGLAQVRGFRGTTFQHSDLTNRLQADLEYLSGWSIWRDIGIVFATIRVLTHRNAF